MPREPFELSFDYDLPTFRIWAHAERPDDPTRRAANFTVGLVLLAMMLKAGSVATRTAYLALFGVYALGALALRERRVRARYRELGAHGTQVTFRFDLDGIRVTQFGQTSELPWSSITAIETNPRFHRLHTTASEGRFVLPRARLSTKDDARVFGLIATHDLALRPGRAPPSAHGKRVVGLWIGAAVAVAAVQWWTHR